MAYARYDRDCDWYIFWQKTKEAFEREKAGIPTPKDEQELAVWHSNHRAEGPTFTYARVKEMLKNKDFTTIPGYTQQDFELIAECLTDFLCDVDNRNTEG